MNVSHYRGPEFFRTQMGMKYYEGTMPRIAKALEDIAARLKETPTAQLDGTLFSDPNDEKAHILSIAKTTLERASKEAQADIMLEFKELLDFDPKGKPIVDDDAISDIVHNAVYKIGEEFFKALQATNVERY